MNATAKTDNTQYMTDAQGRLVPVEAVSDYDQVRDALVREIIASARVLQQQMAAWKAKTQADIDAFVALAGERYEVKLGGRKGNVTLSSFDGALNVKVAISDRINFDERIQVAKALVDGCIHEWTTGSRVELKALVEHAFQTDKQGQINLGRVISLTRLAIDDEKWLRAMQAIRDSMQVTGSATYLRLYEREGQSDRYQQVALDLAAL